MSRAPASPYPHYDVLAKWHSPSFDDATRAVLRRRLHELPPRRFLNEAEWRLLEAVCARLLPQPERSAPIPIVPWIDEMLYCGRGEGFRHDGMPVLGEIWRIGLAEDFASDEEAQQQLYWTDERIIAGADPIALGGNNSGRGVGGSTVHFSMISLRFRPE